MRAFLSLPADRWLIRPTGGAPPAFFGISGGPFDELGTAGSGAHTAFAPECNPPRERSRGRRRRVDASGSTPLPARWIPLVWPFEEEGETTDARADLSQPGADPGARRRPARRAGAAAEPRVRFRGDRHSRGGHGARRYRAGRAADHPDYRGNLRGPRDQGHRAAGRLGLA